MRVLVTGGAGYIGSHAAKALARHDFDPVILDNLSTGHKSAAKFGQLIEGDLCDESSLCELLVAEQIGAVMHFAANAYVGESVENPRKYFRNNVANSLNLLQSMHDAGVKYIVFSSSCATYGVPNAIPILESSPQNPISPYGESKLFIEKALHWLGEADGLRWVSLRYFNAAGADPDGDLGEDHDPETHLIPLAIDVGLNRRQAIQVFGIDYATRDGTAIRDYVHVSDIAEAHVLALRYLLDGAANTALNLGTCCGHSVREVISSVERHLRCSVRTEEASRRPGDPAELVADSSNAKRILGWSPLYSDLDTIVETASAWRKARVGVL